MLFSTVLCSFIFCFFFFSFLEMLDELCTVPMQQQQKKKRHSVIVCHSLHWHLLYINSEPVWVTTWKTQRPIGGPSMVLWSRINLLLLEYERLEWKRMGATPVYVQRQTWKSENLLQKQAMAIRAVVFAVKIPLWLALLLVYVRTEQYRADVI